MEVKFEDLGEIDLVVDTIYKGGKNGNTGDDPLSKIFPKLGNMSGFRKIKRKLIVWINSGELSMESEVSVFLCEVYDKKIRGILFSYGGRRN